MQDVSLATFHLFDRENIGSAIQLARGGCGGCGCGHGGNGGCGHGGGFGGCGHGGRGFGDFGFGWGACCLSWGACRLCQVPRPDGYGARTFAEITDPISPRLEKARSDPIAPTWAQHERNPTKISKLYQCALHMTDRHDICRSSLISELLGKCCEHGKWNSLRLISALCRLQSE
jgi:hypothetical protein